MIRNQVVIVAQIDWVDKKVVKHTSSKLSKLEERIKQKREAFLQKQSVNGCVCVSFCRKRQQIKTRMKRMKKKRLMQSLKM